MMLSLSVVQDLSFDFLSYLCLFTLALYALASCICVLCSASLVPQSTEHVTEDMRSSNHHSLQRKLSPKLTTAPDCSVHWLGRSTPSHVAMPPMYACAASNYTYELSDDFRQKQIDILERKYGGHLRAQRAASTIQRAFREYMLAKRWQAMRNPAVRRKLQRFNTSAQLPAWSNQSTKRFPPQLHHQQSEPSLLANKNINLHRFKAPPPPAPQVRNGVHMVRVCPVPPPRPSVTPVAVYAKLPSVHPNRRRSVSAERKTLRRTEALAKISVPQILTASKDILSYEPPEQIDFAPRPLRLHEASRSSDTSLASQQSQTSGSSLGSAEMPTYMACGSSVTIQHSPVKSRANSIPHTMVYASRASPVDSVSSTSESSSSPVWVPRRCAISTTASQTLVQAPAQHRKQQEKRTPVEARQDDDKKRRYRIALNFFNKKPERGMQLLIQHGFVEANPPAVANFLSTRRGLSKQMIGDYLGNGQNPFHAAVLDNFVSQMDLSHSDVDVALRRFLTHFRLPGEAQKIERIMEVFARRYCECNPDRMKRFNQPDTVFIVAFAIVMLNTDLHSPNIKNERRMKLDDFIKNLKGIDGGKDLDQKLLTAIYNRVKEQEFRPGNDHTTQVTKVDRSIVGKEKPKLSAAHRRLVCYCRLHEVIDRHKKQATNAHQREIFLFNDLIVITKVLNRKKNVVTYNYRQSHSLVGMQVEPFCTPHYPHGLEIRQTLENKTLLFNGRSEEDKVKFMQDLREAIKESDEMEALRIDLEMEKQSLLRSGVSCLSRAESQRDSGLPDLADDATLRPSHRAISNSMLQLAGDRRASLNSLDSGMSSTASIESRECSPKGVTSSLRNG